MRHKLEMQADRIEAVLAAHKVQGAVWGGTVTPRFTRFQVMTASGTAVSRVTGLEEEVAQGLGVPAVRMYRQNGVIQVEVPRSEAPPELRLMRMVATLKKRPPAGTALLGTDLEGLPLLLRVTSPDVVHVLVAGMTGSGKTVLMRSLLASLAMFNSPQDLRMLLIDPKGGRGLGSLAALPHAVGPAATTAEMGGAALLDAVEKMERRDAEHVSRPLLVVAIDELVDLLDVGGSAVEQAVRRLAQRGREAGIHLVAGTQKPAASAIGGLLKANFPVRLVGSVASPEDAKVAAGISGTGAEKLLGRGDFLLVGAGQVIRFQAALVTEGEVGEVGSGALGVGLRQAQPATMAAMTG